MVFSQFQIDSLADHVRTTMKKNVVVDRHEIINVTTLDELSSAMERLYIAQQQFATFSQAKIDHIVECAADHFMESSKRLAQHAHDETGMGIPAHKEAKNAFAVDYIRQWYRGTKTCGIVERDEANGLDIVASPMGIVSAVIPTTNPTSTVAFKALCCLKTRNAIIVAPHPRAKACTTEALRVIIEGAVAAGAPADIAACISIPSLELTGTLMKHPKTSLVLATGGPAMVSAAYSSGHPAVGVGPGNVPVVVDATANLREVAENVTLSKNFDCGVICSSEQVVLAEDSIYNLLKEEFIGCGAHFLSEDEKEKVGSLLFKDGGALNADVVGQTPIKIAEMAGISVPPSTTLLVGEFDDIKTSPFAREKLSPVLGFTKRSSIDALFAGAVEVLRLGGEGHTACYYTNVHSQESRIQRFASSVIVTRCLINQPTAPGGIGGVYNFGMKPSMTLGCGSYGGNYVSDNVGPLHLLNFKRVARVADDHMIVLKNIDCLVPQHRANRCAMEIVILTLVLMAKDAHFLELYPQAKDGFLACKDYLEGSGSLTSVRAAIRYFSDNGLFDAGHTELCLKSSALEFNIPCGNLYPILFPYAAKSLEAAEWSNLTMLGVGVDSMEKATGMVAELQQKANMPTQLVESTAKRISQNGISAIADAIKAIH